jgi:hypothetical protein
MAVYCKVKGLARYKITDSAVIDLCILKNSIKKALCEVQKALVLVRRLRDSNSRYTFGVYTLSRRAP